MSDVLAAAVELQQFLQRQQQRFCIIGGVALARWGEPRATADVDIALLTGFGDEANVADLLLGQFKPRIDNAREFALQNRVLLMRASNGVGIDASLAALPYEERLIERASPFNFGKGIVLITAGAEDLIGTQDNCGTPKGSGRSRRDSNSTATVELGTHHVRTSAHVRPLRSPRKARTIIATSR